MIPRQHTHNMYIIIMAELNDLFEEIFHSERKFKARTDQLKLLNSTIQETAQKLEDNKKRFHIKQGELAVKNNKLVGVEMEVRLLQLRKGILLAQKEELEKSRKELSEAYNDSIREDAKERESFKSTLKEFSRCYDLAGSGLKCREEKDKKVMNDLQEVLIVLETELSEIESYQDEVRILRNELEKVERELRKEKDTEEEFNIRELEQLAMLEDLEKKRDASKSKCSNSNLQSELDACKSSHEEEMCKYLQGELEKLQEEHYRKQTRLQVARQSRQTKTLISGKNVCQHQHSSDSLDASAQLAMQELPESAHFDASDDMFDDNWLDDEEINQEDLSAFEEYSNEDTTEGAASTYLTCPRQEERKIPQTEVLPSRENLPSINFTYNEGQSSSGTKETDFRVPSNLHTTPTSLQKKKKQSAYASPSRKKELFSTMSWESPDPNLIPRKRPGESIYKAPGTSTNNVASSAIRMTKKVRFHY